MSHIKKYVLWNILKLPKNMYNISLLTWSLQTCEIKTIYYSRMLLPIVRLLVTPKEQHGLWCYY